MENKKTDIAKTLKLQDVSFNDYISACPYTFAELKGKRRYRDLTDWRQVGMVIAFIDHHDNRTLKESGELFNKDHATVLHSIRVVVELINHHHILSKIRDSRDKRLIFEDNEDVEKIDPETELKNRIFGIRTFDTTLSRLANDVEALKAYINENINPNKL